MKSILEGLLYFCLGQVCAVCVCMNMSEKDYVCRLNAVWRNNTVQEEAKKRPKSHTVTSLTWEKAWEFAKRKKYKGKNN